MNYNSLQLFEHALFVFSDNSNSKYEMIIEYNNKLITGQFLSDVSTHPQSKKYTNYYHREFVAVDYPNSNFATVEILKFMHEHFVSAFNNQLLIPETKDLINAINHVVSLVSDDAEPLDTFNTATNVTFLETNLKFDFYRFPDDATFNVVSLKKLDN